MSILSSFLRIFPKEWQNSLQSEIISKLKDKTCKKKRTSPGSTESKVSKKKISVPDT